MDSTGSSDSQLKQTEILKENMEEGFSELSTDDENDGSPSNEISLANKHDELIQVESALVNGKDVAIENLEHCEVFVKGIPSSLHVKNLHGCIIIVGPCSRSVSIDECHQCEFAVACQQLFVHTSDECDFYVHINAQPIIEDCHHCRFAPYNVEYQSKQHDIIRSGLIWANDFWDNVLDYNHRVPGVHSPNWETIEEEERKEWSLDLSSPSI